MKPEEGMGNLNWVNENCYCNIPVQNINCLSQGVASRVIRCDNEHREPPHSQTGDSLPESHSPFIFFFFQRQVML